MRVKVGDGIRCGAPFHLWLPTLVIDDAAGFDVADACTLPLIQCNCPAATAPRQDLEPKETRIGPETWNHRQSELIAVIDMIGCGVLRLYPMLYGVMPMMDQILVRSVIFPALPDGHFFQAKPALLSPGT